MLMANGPHGFTQSPGSPYYTKDGEGYIKEEDPAPRPLGKQAANDWAYEEASRAGNLVDAQAKPDLPLAEGIGDDSGRVSDEQSAANALNYTSDDQVAAVKLRLCQAGNERPEGKHDEAAVVEALTPPYIGQAANNWGQNRGDQQVADQHPHDGE